MEKRSKQRVASSTRPIDVPVDEARPDVHAREVRGKVKSYAVDQKGLNLVLEPEPERVFTCAAAAGHYAAAVSMAIAASSTDSAVKLRYSTIVPVGGGKHNILAIGIGQNPVLE